VNELAADAGMLAKAAVEGRLNVRVDVKNHRGDFAKIIDGINRTIESPVGHLDVMPAPAFIIDRDFNIRYMNRLGSSLIGLSRQALIGTKCYEHFKTPDCQSDRCATGRCMQQGRAVTAETDAHPQGKHYDISYTGVPVLEMDGKIIGGLEIIADLERDPISTSLFPRKEGNSNDRWRRRKTN
jgi:methyl-accepting chemotaxis protein